jgi:hypothetical protein
MHSRKLYETAHISQPIWMRTDSLCVCLCMHTETEFDNSDLTVHLSIFAASLVDHCEN